MTFRNSKAVTGIIDWVHFLNNGKTLKPGPFSCNIPSGKASIKRLPMIFKSAAEIRKNEQRSESQSVSIHCGLNRIGKKLYWNVILIFTTKFCWRNLLEMQFRWDCTSICHQSRKKQSCSLHSSQTHSKSMSLNPFFWEASARRKILPLLGSICYRDLGEGARESDLQQGAQWWHGNRRRRR